MATTEPIPDLEVKLADGHMAVRGGWIKATSPAKIDGEINDIQRETDGAHAGRILLVVYDQKYVYKRLVLPENSTSRKPPAVGTMKLSRAKINRSRR